MKSTSTRARLTLAAILSIGAMSLLAWVINPVSAESDRDLAPTTLEKTPADLEPGTSVRFEGYDASLASLGDDSGTFIVQIDGEPRWRWSQPDETTPQEGLGYARVSVEGEHIIDLRNSALGLTGLQPGAYELVVEILQANGNPYIDEHGQPVKLTGTLSSK